MSSNSHLWKDPVVYSYLSRASLDHFCALQGPASTEQLNHIFLCHNTVKIADKNAKALKKDLGNRFALNRTCLSKISNHDFNLV